jgi:uncharacterized membrane protein YgcG
VAPLALSARGRLLPGYLVVNSSVSRDYEGWVRVGRGLLYVGPERNTLIEPAGVAEAAERASLAEALQRPGPEPSALDATEAAVAKAEKVTTQVERGVSILKVLAGGADPATVAKEVNGLLATLLEHYRESRYRDVLRLARVLAGVLMLAQRWRDLVWTLELAKEAAQGLGDVAAQAWALHELGTLHVAAGNSGAAAELLGRARDLFEEAGDPAAAELTSHNLQQIAAIAPPPGVLHRIAEWSATHKAVILTAGAIALLGGVAGAYALIENDGEPGQERGEDDGGGGEDGGGGGEDGGGGGETPAIEVSTTSLDFGSVPVDEGSVAQAYSVTSVASEAITLATIQPGGSDHGDFLPDDSCSGTTLQPGSSCSVAIVFLPQDFGERTAFYALTDPGNGQTRQVTVTGTGTEPSTSDGTEDGTTVPPPEEG